MIHDLAEYALAAYESNVEHVYLETREGAFSHFIIPDNPKLEYVFTIPASIESLKAEYAPLAHKIRERGAKFEAHLAGQIYSRCGDYSWTNDLSTEVEQHIVCQNRVLHINPGTGIIGLQLLVRLPASATLTFLVNCDTINSLFHNIHVSNMGKQITVTTNITEQYDLIVTNESFEICWSLLSRHGVLIAKRKDILGHRMGTKRIKHTYEAGEYLILVKG